MELSHSIIPEIPVEKVVSHCTLKNLPSLCEDIYEVSEVAADGATAKTECLWGVFEVECRPVKNGVRYALTSCPNALQWTVTSRRGETTLHCSINQMAPEEEFAESIREFFQHFCAGVERELGQG